MLLILSHDEYSMQLMMMMNDVGTVSDFNNMGYTKSCQVLFPALRIIRSHPKGQILGDPIQQFKTRRKIQKCFLQHRNTPLIRTKDYITSLTSESLVEAMQEELLQFKLLEVHFFKAQLKRRFISCRASQALLILLIQSSLWSTSSLRAWYGDTFFFSNGKWDSPFELEASFSDSNYGGASLDRKSTKFGCQFLGKIDMLQRKKQLLWQILLLRQKRCSWQIVMGKYYGYRIND
ncbi:hypothetical protein Tco_1140464 [Tanacetum coccineum]